MVKRIISKNCPYCGAAGIVSSMHNQRDLCMCCSKCKERWYSRSGTCPECGKPNKYISNSPCIKCYEKRLVKKHSHAV
jgi:hypothetical protein